MKVHGFLWSLPFSAFVLDLMGTQTSKVRKRGKRYQCFVIWFLFSDSVTSYLRVPGHDCVADQTFY